MSAPSSFGVIESFQQVDAVGSIRLEDGREVRFGRSTCTFEPVVGTRVEVLETTAGFRGVLKATGLRLAEDRAAHASRLGARDASRGVRAPTLGAQEFAATARELGGLTILFEEEVPREIGALFAWMLGLDLEKNGITVEVEGSSLVLFVKGAKVRALVGHDPYPRGEVDLADVPAGFSMGKSAVSLLFSFMPRAYYTQSPDAWLEKGHARAMSRIAKVLLQRGHAVIVHRANELVVMGRRFASSLSNLDDPEFVPFKSWIDVRVIEGGAAYTSVGLRAFGLPEVRIEGRVEPGTWLSARRFEAMHFACYCLCRSMWIEDGVFEVPRRIQIGPYHPSFIGAVDVERWEAKAVASGDLTGNVPPVVLVLRHREDSDDSDAIWAKASLEGNPQPNLMGQGGYEAIYLNGLMTWLSLGAVQLSSRFEASVPHRIITFRGDGPHLMLSTSGIGRVPQPGGTRAGGSDHIELITFVPPDKAAIITEILAVLATMVHGSDRVTLFEPWALYTIPFGTFLLRPWGPIAMGKGAPITLLEVSLLDEAEIPVARGGAAARAKLLGDYDQILSAKRWEKNAKV